MSRLIIVTLTDEERAVLEKGSRRGTSHAFRTRCRGKRWVWLALCRRMPQVVAFAVGDRGETTCKRLWRRVPPAYRRLLCFTDFWDAYGKVLLETQHEATDKGDGQTCHIERWNNMLRKRLARFVRQTLNFNKSDRMHKVCLLLFVHDYSRSRWINDNA